MRPVLLLSAIVAATAVAGCRAFQYQLPSMARQTISPEATAGDVVALVNRNVTGQAERGGLISWSASDVKFSMAPMPMPVPGTIVVEAPRNFRMRVSNPLSGGDELDVGSNADEFWIWQKDMNPPYLLTAHHEDMPLALQHFRVPFQPDWIMEVLGVVPVEPEGYELHPSPQKGYVELVANRQSPTGAPLRKVIRVSSRDGTVMAHQLWGQDGQLVAEAELEQYRADPVTKIVMPGVVRIRWPAADLNLKMSLGRVDVNPVHLNDMYWQVPQKNGFRRLDMGAYARSQSSGLDGVRHVEHETPLPQQGGSRAAPPAGPQPVPSAAAPASPAPFPDSMAPPVREASFQQPAAAFPVTPPSAAPGRPLPARDQSVPADAPGRVRLDSLGP
jgi:hypothetical protein